MRNLVVCCDGELGYYRFTTERHSGPTNVARIYNAVDCSNKKDLKYYHPGVGTEGGCGQNIGEELLVKGWTKNIMSVI
jgi:uncharacterized protein (DUF2235 family)